MDDKLAGEAAKLATQAQELAANLKSVAQQILDMSAQGTLAIPDGHMPFVSLLTIFALACFVGYYVVWRVTPALHSPLMAVTNAVSSVIIVGALLAAGLKGLGAGAAVRRRRRRPGRGQHLRRLHRHAPHAVDVQEEDTGQEVGGRTDMTQELAAYGYLDRRHLLHHGAARAVSSPVTSRQGNLFGIVGMVIAIGVTDRHARASSRPG